MAMKKKNKVENKYIYIAIIVVVLILVLIPGFVYISISSNNKEIEEEFKKEGYNTTKEDAFYRKVTTNNTLDDFYNDLAAGTSTKYQEFYYAKESNAFIELKMLYENKVNTALNISTDLKTNELTYNYELNYKTARLILEGSSKDDYRCNIIVNNKVPEDTVRSYCDYIIDEINEYNSIKEELLKNNKIKDLSES